MSRLLLGILLTSALLLTGCATGVTVNDLQTDTDNGVYEVTGAVMNPGTFNLPPGEEVTIGKAIKRAGGFKQAGDWDDGGDSGMVHVSRLVHGSAVEYTLQAFPGGKDEEFIIKPGDIIRVPKRPFSSPLPNPLPFTT
jgi:protein involved in polysaccharide export with SLBB domain